RVAVVAVGARGEALAGQVAGNRDQLALPGGRLEVHQKAGASRRHARLASHGKMITVAGRRLESLLPLLSSTHSTSMSRKCDWPLSSVYRLCIRMGVSPPTL